MGRRSRARKAELIAAAVQHACTAEVLLLTPGSVLPEVDGGVHAAAIILQLWPHACLVVLVALKLCLSR